MTVTDGDRAKAHALWNEILCNGGVPGWTATDDVAAALASERAAADQLRADVLALAEELEANGRVRETLGAPAWPLNVAARLRVLLAAR